MTIVRSASAHWAGTIKEGRGTVSTQSGVLSGQPYGFNTRFEDKQGTNPEELVGAAHASCYAMALSLALTENDTPPESLDVDADVSLEKQDDGFAVTAVALSLKAVVPGVDQETFKDIAEKTKGACPISKLLNAEISLSIELA
ncbi:OsmC family protein [Halioxenophilus aromaticivorans]|uniref:Peroxiredoxin OsmC n=1 Tax=Halioxenophilus aromaticivorans TaxID=1306992 RepID=A0AAV3U3X8_9ALTE